VVGILFGLIVNVLCITHLVMENKRVFDSRMTKDF